MWRSVLRDQMTSDQSLIASLIVTIYCQATARQWRSNGEATAMATQQQRNGKTTRLPGDATNVLFWAGPASETACNGEFVDNGKATATRRRGNIEATRLMSSSGQVWRERWLAMVNLRMTAKQRRHNGKAMRWQGNGKATR